MAKKQTPKRAANTANVRKRSRRSSAAESMINVLDNEPTTAFRRLWDESSGAYVAEVFELAKARPLVDAAHPPSVMPIRGDPNHVIRCDWDVAKNRWKCRKLPADDPEATI